MFKAPASPAIISGIDSQRGFFLIESLVVIGLFAILGLAFANSMIFGIESRMRAIHRSAAMQIASDLLEGETTVDPSLYTEASGFVDTVTWQGNSRMRFQRALTFTVNADGSRTAVVRVTDLNPRMAGAVELTSTLAPWGSK